MSETGLTGPHFDAISVWFTGNVIAYVVICFFEHRIIRDLDEDTDVSMWRVTFKSGTMAFAWPIVLLCETPGLLIRLYRLMTRLVRHLFRRPEGD